MDPVMLQILAPAFVASLIITGIHAYLGAHVVERGVIFVDLSLAQIAAFGATIALLLPFTGGDPHAPGVYWMSAQEVSQLTAALGQGPTNWVKSKTPPEANKWVDMFREEGKQLSQQNPPGSSWIEKVDCSKHASKIVIR